MSGAPLRSPRVFNVAVGQPFLDALAAAVLAGFPGPRAPSALELARTTILVPNRRAARDLEQRLYERNGGAGLLLPRIRPIGDIDEELFDDPASLIDHEGVLPEAVTQQARELILMDLIAAWARDNPQQRLAQELAAAPQQSVALAVSLGEFLDTLETEEIDARQMGDLFGVEAARHREAILGFLALVQVQLPARLIALGLLGPMQRRAALLRREARRLADDPPDGPVIAAGSTGSIPATRDLLGVIARLPKGAIVLPGLDMAMDEASWAAAGPQHPQYLLKSLVAHLGISRSDVAPLPGTTETPRAWLVSEIMRPTETSEDWQKTAADCRAKIAAGVSGVSTLETRHVPEEAHAIALALREALEAPERTACLVTPDRELARRVKLELQGLGIAIDDSAGEPLIGFGIASLMAAAIDAVLGGLAPESVMALLRHGEARFGLEKTNLDAAADVIELAAYRAGSTPPALAGLSKELLRRHESMRRDSHVPAALARHDDRTWADAVAVAQKLADTLCPLSSRPPGAFGGHVMSVLDAVAVIAGADWPGESGEALRTLIDDLLRDASSLPEAGFVESALYLRHVLAVTALRPRRAAHARLAILGLLEARLVQPDLMILGGLNEGRWPALASSGPWLNRPMRERLNMQQPERAIGQTAHDFAQAFGCREVLLTWSRRVGDAPVIPSRWILRLRMLLKAASVIIPEAPWQALSAAIQEPATVTPCGKPKPSPPVAARPKSLGVTRVEVLIRDPYAIYAERVLNLKPLEEMGDAAAFSRRGMIFHEAIGNFLKLYPQALPPDGERELLRFGRASFGEVLTDPETGPFWWPQFERIARAFLLEEEKLRADARQVFAEIDGKLILETAAGQFRLTCRADRIDLLNNGTARIIDYKTGSVKSSKQVNAGLAPQLTLEAAMLKRGAFAAIGAALAGHLAYVKLGAGDPPVKENPIRLDDTVEATANRDLSGLLNLLAVYADPARPYLPRVMAEKEDDALPYDHFSRYREWALSGGKA
ncbi:double-strand break repair protein AddB [Aestuariivirga sp.]|uniref:double-strand break repair protein AddB n=1 Tax=Aestuariivirga sp. TaxID=2650926 RepID=UPI0039E38561